LDAYEHLYNAPDINMIIDGINEMFLKTNKNMFSACHGRYHTMFVIDKVEYILNSLSYDSRTIELGKIAALLHDIGNIAGRWNHAVKSSVLAKVFFDGSDHLLPEEKSMIVQAIEDHSDGNNLSSAIGAALLIADKSDISKRRILPVETIDAWHENLLEIEDVGVCVYGEIISMNFITTEAFSKELLISGYEQGFQKIMRAIKYLGCIYYFQINGMEEKFD